MKPETAGEREAFEQWYSERNNMAKPTRHRDGGYDAPHCNNQWLGWQARAAREAQPVAPAVWDQRHALFRKLSIAPVDAWGRLLNGVEGLVILNALAAPQSSPPSVPAGWKLVPVEPTFGMEAAGKRESREIGKTIDSVCERVYKAMLAASPPSDHAAGEQKT